VPPRADDARSTVEAFSGEAPRRPVSGTARRPAERGYFVSTGGAGPGDALVQVGLAPVEGAAVLAVEAETDLGDLPAGLLEAAVNALDDPGLSVVEPALVAAELGATAMHDPTEGGMAAGLHEMSLVADVALGIDTRSVLWFEPGLAVSLGNAAPAAAAPPEFRPSRCGSPRRRGRGLIVEVPQSLTRPVREGPRRRHLRQTRERLTPDGRCRGRDARRSGSASGGAGPRRCVARPRSKTASRSSRTTETRPGPPSSGIVGSVSPAAPPAETTTATETQ
jgi:hypothetical protein